MKKSFLVVGLGAFGEAVARTLHSQGHTVMAVDIRRDRVERAREITSEAVEGNATDRATVEQVVENLGAEDIEAAVVAVGQRLDASILVCLFLKELGVKRIVAKVLTDDHAQILKQLGVGETVFPEADSGARLAHRLARPNLVDLLPLGGGVGVYEVTAPAEFVGSTLGELKLRNRYEMMVIAIRPNNSDEVEMMPGADTAIREGDLLVVLGTQKAIEKISS